MKVLNKIEADFNDIVANENDTIKNLRVENFGEFRKQGIPTSKEEFWKFTNPSIIKDSEFSLGTSSEFTDNNFDIILVNGKLIKRNEKIVNKDIQNSLNDRIIDMTNFEKTDNPFINLNNAFSTEGCVINFSDNSEEEISILNVVDNTSSEQIIHPRMIIVAGKNSRISVLEEIRFLGNNNNLVNSVTNFHLSEGSSVEHVIIDDYSENTYQISNVIVKQKRDSTFSSYNYSNAKKLARRDFIVELKERGSHCDLRGVYLADEKNHIDHHTIIEHEDEHCTSNELYKGILSGKPELEIYADDVKCTHGATIGQLDEKGIFYLRARGIKREDAQKMMMRAYIGEVLKGMKHKKAKEILLEKIIDNIPDGD